MNKEETASQRLNASDTSWMATAGCEDQDPNFFFPTDKVGVDKAKEFCQGCLVREVCLEYAIENRIDHGVWGGESERQRRRIIKARAEQSIAKTAIDAAN